MNFYIQFGHGMMTLTTQLIRSWGGGSVILSPRDLSPQQLVTQSRSIREAGGSVLVDPQFYVPRSDHHQLIAHSYWVNDYETDLFSDEGRLIKFLGRIIELNNTIQTNELILPGYYCREITNDWISLQASIIANSNIYNGPSRLATMCLSSDVLRSEANIETVINIAENWDTEGVYLIPERPNSSYLAEDPLWLNNLLLLCSGLKLQGKKVVVGYANHQLLLLGTANVDSIAVGNFLNVRSFRTGRFEEAAPTPMGRRAKWYYCPQAFSEYKLQFLDMAHQRDILNSFAPPTYINPEWVSMLFSGAQPTSTLYKERNSFMHYISCLRNQSQGATRASYQETFNYHMNELEEAEHFIEFAHAHGVLGQDRDFGSYIDVSKSALLSFDSNKGDLMRRLWR